MFITAFFTNIGVPEAGLSPTIRIRRVDTGALVVTDDSMIELGDGFYKYDFTTFDGTLDYVFRSDGTATLNDGDRYVIGTNEIPIDDVNNDSVRLDVDGLIASAVDKIVDQVWNELTSGHQAVGSTGLALTDGYTLTAEQVNAIADGVWDEKTSKHQAPGTFGLTSGVTAAEIADAVWNEATADHQTAGSTGLALIDAYGLTSGQVNAIADAVWDEATTGHQAPGTTGLALIDAYGLTPGQVDTITNAVWDEQTSEHTAGGTTGLVLTASNATADTIADAVWDELTADHQTAGTTGLKLDSTAAPSDLKIYESEPSEPK